jgi:hypothetical protein
MTTEIDDSCAAERTDADSSPGDLSCPTARHRAVKEFTWLDESNT